jgi:cytochrome b pre-mRNA-processing protein 3
MPTRSGKINPMPFRWLGQGPQDDTIHGLYGAIVAQARKPAFYRAYGVPDTVNGRLDMIMLHLVLLLRRLRGESEALRELGQRVFDLFCRDVDHNLREMGVGDLAVPKHMRQVAEAFYGCAAAYDRAFAERDTLAGTLARNILDVGEESPKARRLERYVNAAIDSLAAQDDGALRRGVLRFPEPGAEEGVNEGSG